MYNIVCIVRVNNTTYYSTYNNTKYYYSTYNTLGFFVTHDSKIVIFLLFSYHPTSNIIRESHSIFTISNKWIQTLSYILWQRNPLRINLTKVMKNTIYESHCGSLIYVHIEILKNSSSIVKGIKCLSNDNPHWIHKLIKKTFRCWIRDPWH